MFPKRLLSVRTSLPKTSKGKPLGIDEEGIFTRRTPFLSTNQPSQSITVVNIHSVYAITDNTVNTLITVNYTQSITVVNIHCVYAITDNTVNTLITVNYLLFYKVGLLELYQPAHVNAYIDKIFIS